MAFDQMDFNFGGGHGGGSHHDLGNGEEPHSPFEHHIEQDAQSSLIYGAVRSQAQGQGEQSQNQSQIMQQNLSGFGMFPGDEPSSILEVPSSRRGAAPHQQLPASTSTTPNHQAFYSA